MARSTTQNDQFLQLPGLPELPGLVSLNHNLKIGYTYTSVPLVDQVQNSMAVPPFWDKAELLQDFPTFWRHDTHHQLVLGFFTVDIR